MFFLLSKSYWKRIIQRGDGEMMIEEEGKTILGHDTSPGSVDLKETNVHRYTWWTVDSYQIEIRDSE